MIWYAGYGSNLHRDRFLHYLEGGAPAGAQRTLPGARDTSHPLEERGVVLPGSMYFAWESPTWGGGVSFLDVEAGDECYARAYRLSEEQFADVAAQEMHRQPGDPLDLSGVLRHGRHTYGPGRYETLHHVGDLDGEPLLTFAPEPTSRPALNSPSPIYLAMLVEGLRSTHQLEDAAWAAYLLARPGIGDWTAEQLTGLAGDGGC